MTPDNAALTPLLNEATALMKALSHPARLMICCELRDKELSVGDIETTLKITQPRLSRELAKLRELKLVSTRRRSKQIYYTLCQESRAAAMVDAICSVMLKDLDNSAPATHIQTQTNIAERQPECAHFATIHQSDS